MQLTASFSAQNFHLRWFWAQRRAGRHRHATSRRTGSGFQIAGPNARELLGAAPAPMSRPPAFPFLSVRQLSVGPIPVTVARVSYTGDLGYEIYCARDHQVALYGLLAAAGARLGAEAVRDAGDDVAPAGKALRLLDARIPARLHPGRDRPRPLHFLGARTTSSAATRRSASARPRRPPADHFLVDADDADVVAYEPIFDGDAVLGFCTSGGYAHWAGKSVALGFLPRERIDEGAEFTIEILGKRRKAVVHTAPLFDPDAARMRG